MRDEFDGWIADRELDLLEKFLSQNREIESKWAEFTWNEFEKSRRLEDEIYEQDI